MCSTPPDIPAALPKLRRAFKGPIGAYPNIGYKPKGGAFPEGGQWHGLDTTTYSPAHLASGGAALARPGPPPVFAPPPGRAAPAPGRGDGRNGGGCRAVPPPPPRQEPPVRPV